MHAAPGARARVLAGLLWLLGLALLAWALHGVDRAALSVATRRVPAAVWLLAAAGWLFTYVIRAWRLRCEWRAQRLVALGRCLRLVLLHNAAVLLSPMRLGEAGYVWLVHSEWGVGVAQAARSLLWLRWQDAAVLATLGLLLLPPWAWPWRLALAAGAFGLALWLPAWGARRAATHRLPRQLLAAAAQRGVDADGWGAAWANWLLRLGVLGLLFSQLAGASGPAVLAAAIGTELGGVLPLQGPAGLGPYEAGAWAGARLAGVPAAPLAGAAVVAHVFCVAVALAAALCAQGLRPFPARAVHPVEH
jgi:hypothetical protein